MLILSREKWRDAFVEEGVALGVNADAVDSVLRVLEKEKSWACLRLRDPKVMAVNKFLLEKQKQNEENK